MKWVVGLGVVVGALVLGGALYVRLAPSDPARWHRPADLSGFGHFEGSNWHVWRGSGDRALFERLDGIIREEPRTKVLAGSVEEGMITYVTRSKVWGFPDYATLRLYGDAGDEDGPRHIEINSRARFGKSDLGVNRARVERWLAAAGQGG
ncbi:DUF1499 domain-containing protein [Roseovarius sp. SCSIO 43702]|uniref:DUF1499 domain-containing protein n=1 Tax=Roseovarius sp. SCSIO 43702 TaxID=2823043 RepID=UPI001C72FD5C|nr:DUF1499 domain-containing protein [Roseovarius sp. SCSIO 43702]QYX58346.1 DUF1499 domain-containing protein [Roseovarius sp. SCSIO 43702]